MNKSVAGVVSFRQGRRRSWPALAACVWISTFAQTAAAADAADASNAAAAPESGGGGPGSALQEVIINAQRTSAETARKAQFEAPNIINVQTYTEIRKLPDISTAEAVRRIPGVSLETDEGEGRYVNIRGIDADLNSTTFGGLRLPPTNNASPFGGYRAVTLDSIPIGLVGAITVTKTNLPSQDAEAIGGTIEITPKTAPLTGTSFLEGQVGGGYQNLREKPIYDVSLSGGGRFGGAGRPGGAATDAYSDRPFSVVATATYYEDWRGIDDVEPAYFNAPPLPYYAINNLQQRDYELNRRRHGWGLDFGYQPDANNRWYLRGFEAGYNERYWRQYFNLTPDGNAVQGANGITDTLNTPNAMQMAFRDERELSKDQVFMAGGENHFGGTVLDYRAGYTKGSWHKPYDYNSAFSYTPTPTNASWTYSASGRGFTPLYTLSGADYLNPANYLLNGFANSSAYNYDKEWSGVINLELPVHWGSFDDESLKMGVSGRWRTKEETAYPTSYPTLPNLLLSDIATTPYETYYQGQYRNPPDIPPGYLQSLLGPGTQAPADVIAGQQQYLSAKENVYAAYLMYQMRAGRFGIVGGVRAEHTHDDLNAYQTSNDSAGNPCCAVPVEATHNYTNWFPGIQTRFEIQPDLIARATWSTTLARPGFNQISISQFVDLGSGIITVGNPNLKPAIAHSFDATLEYYLPEAGILQFGLFDKQIDNYIVSDNTGTQLVFFHGTNVLLRSYTFSNSTGAYARGAEFAWTQRFRSLPGFLAGFGITANYTYVKSSFNIRPGETAPLPSSSKNTWNVALFYQYAGLDMRLAVYSTSADLFGIGSDNTSDVYNDYRTSMDFGSAYSFSDHWGIYFNAKNLLNTPHTFYQGTPDRPIQREFYGQTYQLGVRFNF